ncbi:Zinc finger C2H2 [Perkinsela sp. CCAP 1560/4]|nr:Zinc finger C2H2 [Perkinsela sp. CCAP 1560/4]|eukprot:KNH06161.1 Zinc finger C2H2 [Perkinsela sp. CCAP 1560/4]
MYVKCSAAGACKSTLFSLFHCCSAPPAPSPLRPSADTRRKRGRTTDPVACTECAVVLASRSTGVNHLATTHGYDRKEALRLLQREPPAPPRVSNAPQRCPYCPRTCPSVASVNRHVVAMHRDEARIKRARPGDAPAALPAANDHSCHMCSFVSSSKGGLTLHLRRTQGIDRRVPRGHRPSDCEESAKHLIFDCPRLTALRIKHGIRPQGDNQQWFERRVPDFLLEALHLLPCIGYEDVRLPASPTIGENLRSGPPVNTVGDRLARVTPSVRSSSKKRVREASSLACAKRTISTNPQNGIPRTRTAATTAVEPPLGCAPRSLKRKEKADA